MVFMRVILVRAVQMQIVLLMDSDHVILQQGVVLFRQQICVQQRRVTGVIFHNYVQTKPIMDI